MRSFSKIRHIQEVNKRLEKRTIQEQMMDTDTEVDMDIENEKGSKESSVKFMGELMDLSSDFLNENAPEGIRNKEAYSDAIDELENYFNYVVRVLRGNIGKF